MLTSLLAASVYYYLDDISFIQAATLRISYSPRPSCSAQISTYRSIVRLSHIFGNFFLGYHLPYILKTNPILCALLFCVSELLFWLNSKIFNIQYSRNIAVMDSSSIIIGCLRKITTFEILFENWLILFWMPTAYFMLPNSCPILRFYNREPGQKWRRPNCRLWRVTIKHISPNWAQLKIWLNIWGNSKHVLM